MRHPAQQIALTTGLALLATWLFLATPVLALHEAKAEGEELVASDGSGH